jgi:hypothetical protein
MARHLPEDAVARLPERRRQPVRVGRLKVDRQTLIVGRPPAVHVIVRRHEPDVFAASGRPDISQVEHPQ